MRTASPSPRGTLSLASLLLALVAFAVVVVSGAMTAVNYYFDTRLAERAAGEEFTSIALRGTQAAARLASRGERLAVAMATQADLDVPVGEDLHPLVRPMTQSMQAVDHIFSLFVGYASGDYLEVSDLEAAQGLRDVWNARNDERWVVVQIFERAGERSEVRRFLDARLTTTRTQETRSDYRATERPWYTNAQVNSLRRTPPYLLDFVEQRGMSYTVGNEEGTVAGSLVLLSSVDEILASARFPRSFAALIFDVEGRIIAGRLPEASFVGAERADLPGNGESVLSLFESLAGSGASGPRLRQVVLDGEDHFTWVQPIDSFSGSGAGEFIGIMGRRSEILAPYREQALLALALSLAAAILLVPVVFLATRSLSRPINRLAAESRKVSKRAYAEVREVPTWLREVRWLSASMVSMAESIQDYEQKQRDLHDGFVRLIAAAIDQKSPYTGGHCARVPAIAWGLAEAASRASTGPFQDFSLDSEAEEREFRIAAWLHDCGKITTPEHIVDKGVKLEANYNRIHEVRMRFEVLLRDAEIDYLDALHRQPEQADRLRAERDERQAALREEFAFVAQCNIGGESMDDDSIERLRQIATRSWRRQLDDRLGLSPLVEVRLQDLPAKTPADEPLLADRPEHLIPRKDVSRFEGLGFTLRPTPLKQNLGELYNLSIRRGTLTEEDRYLINEHICSTIEMLETLPWPEDLQRVPEIAGGHHEKMDGTGYPRGLRREELSTAARIMAIADVLEALTAADRPYKKAKTLSQSLGIMRNMALGQHIDPDLFCLLIESGAYRAYAEAWLDPAQIDAVDEEALLSGLRRDPDADNPRATSAAA
jgi:HD-GYP domain-containing protein (c-di-GMP phosphodiesterase class II)